MNNKLQRQTVSSGMNNNSGKYTPSPSDLMEKYYIEQHLFYFQALKHALQTRGLKISNIKTVQRAPSMF